MCAFLKLVAYPYIFNVNLGKFCDTIPIFFDTSLWPI